MDLARNDLDNLLASKRQTDALSLEDVIVKNVTSSDSENNNETSYLC